jgi:hypothetical protein
MEERVTWEMGTSFELLVVEDDFELERRCYRRILAAW